MSVIALNIKAIRDRISAAARRSGRSPQEIKLVAVVKNVPLPLIEAAIEAGITDIGENRVQEAAERNKILREKYPQLTFHMIGHLQTNKVRQALDMFAIIQSVDSQRLVDEINQKASQPVPILIEVNTAGETAKYGVEPDQARELARYGSACEKVQVQGLMTIAPLSGEARGAFRKLRELRDQIAGLKLPGVEMQSLSMGMTNDFEIAIEEGSNLIRIGRGIFNG